MDEAKVVLELDRLTKQRPRTNFYTRSVYTPAQTKEREQKIGFEFKRQNREWVCADGPVSLFLSFEIKIPSKARKEERLKMLNEEILPTIKPDVDNTLKLVMDALTGIAYKDDTQVTTCTVNKTYGETNKLYIIIRKI